MRPAVIGVLLFGMLLAGCGTEGGYYYFPEYFADYLGLSEPQREEVLPVLEDVQGEMITFFKEWMPVLRERERAPIIASDSSLDSARTIMWELMRAKGGEIMPHLTPQQQDKFSRVELPDLNLRELFQVQRSRELIASKDLKGSRTINPAQAIEKSNLNEVSLERLRESRTICIGFQRMSGNRLGSVSRGFPLFIQATIVDPALAGAEKLVSGQSASVAPMNSGDANNFQVNLSLSTGYHESYLDLKRWIVYLETGGGTKIEPEEITKRNEPYIREAPNPFRQVFMNANEDIPMIRSEGPGPVNMVQGDMNAGERGMPAFSMQRAYYTLAFPRQYEGKNLLDRDGGELKLIFLNEINGDERGEGSWEFE